MTLSNQTAKFKFRQYQLRAISQDLMLTKLNCYTVFFVLQMLPRFNSDLGCLQIGIISCTVVDIQV